MRKRLLAVLLTLAVVLSTALTGCGGSTPTTDTSKPADTNAQQSTQDNTPKLDADQTVSCRGYDFKTLNISAESDAQTFTTYNQVFEGLMREVVDEKGDHVVVPALAKEMKISQDGLVYTFILRDAKWSDGQPITAKDFEFSWKRLIDPANAFDYGNFLSMVKNVPEYQAGNAKVEDVGIKALDDKTFEVTLGNVTPYFDKLMTFGCLVPQREDLVKAQGDQYGQDYKTAVYSGPFVISDYQKSSKIVYSKNPNYWDAANVKLEKAECPIVDEPATQVQLFQAKQIENLEGQSDFIAQLDANKDAGGYDHILGYNGGSYYIVFNTKNPVLANAKVRQAMTAAFDRQAYVDIVFKRNVPAYGFICPQLACGDKVFRNEIEEPVKKLVSDVKDPKALFIEGLKEMNMDPDPSKITLQVLNGPQSSLSSAQSQFIQDQFSSKIGIKLELIFSVDNPTYFQSRTKGEFDLCPGGWGADFNDVSNFFGIFKTGDGNNNGKWSNKEFDDLLDQGVKELDTAKRLEIYKKAEQILCADDPAIIMAYYGDLQIFRYKYVKGFMVPLFGGYYSLKNVYIQGKN